MLGKFWPSSGRKMTENGGFWPLYEKLFMQSNSNSVCKLIWWVFRIDLLLGHIGQNFGPLVATRGLKLVVSDCYLQNYSQSTIQTWCLHLLGECSQLICFRATLGKFCHSSKQKLMKLGENVVSDHHQLNYPLNPIDSWCAHLFGESSEMIPCFAT